MDFEKLMSVLKSPQSNVWVSGRIIDRLPVGKSMVDLWEYSVRVPDVGDVIVRGLDTNNLPVKVAHASAAVNGQPVKLDNVKYLALFDQLGHLFAVVQPARIKENGMRK